MKMNRRTATKTILATATGGLSLPRWLHAVPLGADRASEGHIRTQVCVIGGGSGGIGAALAAARQGTEVVLLEREAILGGTMTTAWVHT